MNGQASDRPVGDPGASGLSSEPEHSRWLWLLPSAVIVVAAAVVAVLVVVDRDPPELGERETRLVAAATPGPGPFGEPVTHGVPETGIRLPPAPTEAIVAGDTPALYAAMRDAPRCSSDEVSASFEDGASEVWAASQGVEHGDLDGYLDSLFPVALRRDTAVTSHRLAEGRAVAEPVVLQRGTVVLIDDRGVPRLRCAGLQPLGPPSPSTEGYSARGSAWFGFRAAGVVRVRAAASPVEGFEVVDLMTGDMFVRGRSGIVDRDL